MPIASKLSIDVYYFSAGYLGDVLTEVAGAPRATANVEKIGEAGATSSEADRAAADSAAV